MEPKIRHLEMIRGAINNASDNSLRIKGFAMLLLAGTVALLFRFSDGAGAIPFLFGLLLILIVLFLFLLDLYFIRQADVYRILYNRVRRAPVEDVDFSMEDDQIREELNDYYRYYLPFPPIASGVIHICIIVMLIVGMLPPQ